MLNELLDRLGLLEAHARNESCRGLTKRVSYCETFLRAGAGLDSGPQAFKQLRDTGYKRFQHCTFRLLVACCLDELVEVLFPVTEWPYGFA